jgi:hypothetical protein
MSSQRKRASWHPTLRGLLALVGIAGVIGAATPAQAGVVAARQALEARVLAVRAAIHDPAEADPRAGALDRTLAQPNWRDWNNWPNWSNWRNWFNR